MVDSTKQNVKHTTGPWKYYEQNDGMFAVRSEVTNQRVSLGVQEPDARLIAAAPEMLEALKMLTRDNIHRAKLIGANVNWAAIHQAEAAIRKAVGDGR